MARVASLACVGGLAFIVCVCAFGGSLLKFLLAYAFLTIASFRNTSLMMHLGPREVFFATQTVKFGRRPNSTLQITRPTNLEAYITRTGQLCP